ncbi:32 kda heat shock protein-related [Anaeramoeba flamelloides]|uniref:32 kDa heat shock protein-related n=1 Tax=Anaeramoeba flamelloides TaxID=1746091 RepID=A0ABQ8X5K6_9EUKA|nr:32 kda heat shock protein-related [Anaeramoeba flamelloides]
MSLNPNKPKDDKDYINLGPFHYRSVTLELIWNEISKEILHSGIITIYVPPEDLTFENEKVVSRWLWSSGEDEYTTISDVVPIVIHSSRYIPNKVQKAKHFGILANFKFCEKHVTKLPMKRKNGIRSRFTSKPQSQLFLILGIEEITNEKNIPQVIFDSPSSWSNFYFKMHNESHIKKKLRSENRSQRNHNTNSQYLENNTDNNNSDRENNNSNNNSDQSNSNNNNNSQNISNKSNTNEKRSVTEKEKNQKVIITRSQMVKVGNENTNLQNTIDTKDIQNNLVNNNLSLGNYFPDLDSGHITINRKRVFENKIQYHHENQQERFKIKNEQFPISNNPKNEIVCASKKKKLNLGHKEMNLQLSNNYVSKYFKYSIEEIKKIGLDNNIKSAQIFKNYVLYLETSTKRYEISYSPNTGYRLQEIRKPTNFDILIKKLTKMPVPDLTKNVIKLKCGFNLDSISWFEHWILFDDLMLVPTAFFLLKSNH